VLWWQIAIFVGLILVIVLAILAVLVARGEKGSP
jgi:hypothetical protein